MTFSDVSISDGSAAMIERSAWAQADVHLAKAILLSNALEKRVRAAGRKMAPANSKLSLALEADALMVRQAINSAAQARGLAPFGKQGEICAFDAELHEYAQTPPRGRRSRSVKIVVPGVASSPAQLGSVIIRAIVAAAPAKPKTRRENAKTAR